jgi:hypothetical protein
MMGLTGQITKKLIKVTRKICRVRSVKCVMFSYLGLEGRVTLNHSATNVWYNLTLTRKSFRKLQIIKSTKRNA